MSSTDAEIDAAMERRMELTQLKAGDTLSADHAAEIQAVLDELDEEVERGGDAYAQGEAAGRLEAGGATVADLLKKLDAAHTEIAVQRALSKLYGAEAARLREEVSELKAERATDA